jgi:hypothetical protein
MAIEYRVQPPNPAESSAAKQVPIVHPPWCDPNSCSVNAKGKGTHCSRALELRANPEGPLGIELILIQSVPSPGYPQSGELFVAVTFLDTADGYDFGTIPMGVDTAQQLGRLLTSAPQAISSAVGAK